MSEFDPQQDRQAPDEPVLSDEQTAADAEDVAEALRGLSEVISGVGELEDVLNQIAGFAKACIPGADGVGVTLVQLTTSPRTVLAWAVTDAFVRDVDQLQYEVCNEGPCLTAMQTQRPLTSGSVGSDARWPRFGARVARLKVFSALALPLLAGGTVVGAINVYARDRDAFTQHAVRLAEQFAGPAGISVHNTRLLHAARAQAAQLQTALTSRAVIDQAIGIVRSRSGGSADEAFDRLRRISQAENVKLADVAARVVDEAVRRAHARHSSS